MKLRSGKETLAASCRQSGREGERRRNGYASCYSGSGGGPGGGDRGFSRRRQRRNEHVAALDDPVLSSFPSGFATLADPDEAKNVGVVGGVKGKDNHCTSWSDATTVFETIGPAVEECEDPAQAKPALDDLEEALVDLEDEICYFVEEELSSDVKNGVGLPHINEKVVDLPHNNCHFGLLCLEGEFQRHRSGVDAPLLALFCPPMDLWEPLKQKCNRETTIYVNLVFCGSSNVVGVQRPYGKLWVHTMLTVDGFLYIDRDVLIVWRIWVQISLSLPFLFVISVLRAFDLLWVDLSKTLEHSGLSPAPSIPYGVFPMLCELCGTSPSLSVDFVGMEECVFRLHGFDVFSVLCELCDSLSLLVSVREEGPIFGLHGFLEAAFMISWTNGSSVASVFSACIDLHVVVFLNQGNWFRLDEDLVGSGLGSQNSASTKYAWTYFIRFLWFYRHWLRSRQAARKDRFTKVLLACTCRLKPNISDSDSNSSLRL